MGGSSKELNLMDLIRNGDSQAALKILFKNKPKNDGVFTSKFKRTNKTSENSDGTKNNQKGYGTLKNKFNVNFQDEYGKSIVHEACINGNIDIIKLLIESGAKLDITDKRGFRPIHYACQHGRTEITSLLIRNGANCIEPSIYTQETPLHLAIPYQNTLNNNLPKNMCDTAETLVFLILSNGGNISLNIVNKTHKMTPFDLACELGKTKLVKIILNYCSENFITNNLNTNYDQTVISEHSLLEFIMKYSPNSIHLGAKNGHNDIIRLLLIYGVSDINRISSRHQGTPLHEACRHGRLQTVKLLLECGIDIDRVNPLNQTATDVIIKQKVENDIRCMIKEYSQSVYSVSVQPYLSTHSGALNFDQNELIVILDRPEPTITSISNNSSEIYSSLGASSIYGSGVKNLWRGFILNRNNFTTRSGYFPSSFVNVVDLNEMSYQLKTRLGIYQKNPIISPDTSEIYGPAPVYNYQKSPNQKIEQINSKNVIELIRLGMNDSQIIYNWLTEFKMEQYYQNFVQAGYDLLTIFKTTPADLSAIGIYEPTHRQIIKQNMLRLNITELEEKFNLLLGSVSSLEDLLKLIHLENYYSRINSQKVFNSVHDFAEKLSWEDLEEIGVNKLGHQKKLMLVAKRLKEVNSLDIKQKMTPIKLNNNNSRSMENLNGNNIIKQGSPQKNIDKPIPPKRLNSNIQGPIEIPGVTKKAAPFLPPRKSSMVNCLLSSTEQNNSNYATLPNNKNRNINIAGNFLIQNNNTNTSNKDFISTSASPSSSQVSTSSSGTISPSSTSSSSTSQNVFFDSGSNTESTTNFSTSMHHENIYNDPNRNYIQRFQNNNNNSHFYNSMNQFNERKDDLQQRYLIDKASSRAYITQNITNIKNKLNYGSTKIRNNSNNIDNQINLINVNQWEQPERGEKPEENVLSDIDNMLCDLNKQLDDMLVGERELK